MDFSAERARFTPDPALANWVSGTVQSLLDEQAQKDAARVAEATRLAERITLRDTELHAANIKIQALTLELAPLRRMRFGVRNESLSADQRDLFQETLAGDLAAAEAEMAKRLADAPATPPVPRPGPVVSPSPSTCRASNTATNRSFAPAANAARIGSRSVRISASHSMSSRPVSSCIAPSARNTPAVPARAFPPHRFPPP